MPIDRTPPRQDEIRRWFEVVGQPPDDTFEFALVMGGTVSAGSYTAGAVDFLIEALDAFSDAKAKGAAPPHEVILKTVAGTSGGGVNAAIAARALNFRYPHVTRQTPTGIAATNPFYDVWVNKLRLQGFLDIDDIGKTLVSLLNGKPIDEGAASIVDYATPSPMRRDWLGAPLTTIFTLTNLRGVPYRTNFSNELRQGYVDHADHVRVGLVYPHQTLETVRPDELYLGFDERRLPQASTWEQFSDFARATAAFPVGFPARTLSRPTEHYRWRPSAYPPGPDGPSGFLMNWPDWDAMAVDGQVPNDWHFLSVDGGTTNNEPIDLARRTLAGLFGRNPRDPKVAHRAVWLIDPFAGQAPLGPDGFGTFVDTIGSVVTTLTQQTRYDSADLLLAADDDVASRFMLTPTRGNAFGDKAIASSGLGAFIGFACPAFMRFDYLLGRMNCQAFLRETFVLHQDNTLFKNWSPEDRRRFAVANKPNQLPIIPLVGEVAMPETLDPWPKGKLDPEVYRQAIEARFRAVAELELSTASTFRNILNFIGAYLTEKQAADFAIGAMRKALLASGL